MKTYATLHLFCGLGGGAKGFQVARAKVLGLEGRFETLCGVDNDADACADFETITGAPSLCADVATLTPERLREACRGRAPDVVFTSPPCKGFSGLLNSARLAEEKYQALNRLVFQGLFLVLETWPDTPPKLIVLENVPRIRSRGAEFLRQIRSLLAEYGYRFHEGTHDCGEVGGLAQHRQRYLLVARHERQVPAFVYRPPHRRVRAIGEVLGEMPLPDDHRGGPMHVLPRLEWKTWVRLALIPAGGDWRALGRKDDGPWHRGVYGIVPWSASSGTVTGNGRPGAGAFSVADPRLPPGRYNNQFRVVRFDEPSVAVTGGGTPTSGGVCVADPRFTYPESSHHNVFRVTPWGDPAGTVTGNGGPSSGGIAVADPRFPKDMRSASHGVTPWSKPMGTVTGESWPSNGAFAISDPRIAGKDSRPGLFGVMGWGQPAKTITGSATPSSSNCPATVADPRFGCDMRAGSYGIAAWGAPSPAVVGAADVHAGSSAVADPRIPADDDRLDPAPVIIALDGTWHRPLTTLELAALQGLPVFDAQGRPLKLAGASHASWRERIGNAVPPPAAQAVAESLLHALLSAATGAVFALGGTPVWVQPEAV